MQLHYCDGCNLRVDDEDAVTVGDHVYCKACATKMAGGRAAPGASGVRAGTPGAGGVRSVSRSSQALPHVGSAAGLARHTPASGVLHRTPSGGVARRSPGSSGRLRIAPAAPPPAVPTQQPAEPAPGRVPTGSMTRRAPPPTGKMRATTAAIPSLPPAGQSGSSPPARRSAGHMADADRGSNTMTWALAAAGVALAIVGMVLMTRGSQGASTPKTDSKTGTGTVDGKSSGDKTSGGATGGTGSDGKPEDKKETSKSGLFNTGGMEDIREGVAQRELDKIIEAEKGGQLSKLELYKRYQALVSVHGRTKPGQVAAGRAKALASQLSRPPDRPAAATPGLDLKIYEKTPGDMRMEGLSVAGLKSIGDKTVPNIDIPDKGALGAVTGGRQDEVVLRFSGYVEAPRDGNYTFITRSDDGSVLYIGDSLIVSNEGSHAMQDRAGDIPLVAGKHRFRADYYQGNGDAGLIVSWAGPDSPQQTIPASAFSHGQ
ncbi:MAG: PA14 domain-containing protein [Planctomycetota bacterium]|nr:PA14 domain-containing protein [Planctomycetota bacterium]